MKKEPTEPEAYVPFPYQYASLAKLRQYKGMAGSEITEEKCPCTRCHHDGKPYLSVTAAIMGMCETCLMRSCSQVRVMTPEVQEAAYRLGLSEASVPIGYRSFSWQNWTGPVPERRLRDWRGVPWCVWFYGPTGVGKTHLSVAMVGEWQAEKGRLRFAVASSLLEELKACFDIGDHRLLTESRTCRLLVLDDAFTGKESEKWGRPTLCDILRARHANNAATIVTSNVPPSKIAEFDAPLASRLGEGIRVDMSARTDYRMRRKP